MNKPDALSIWARIAENYIAAVDSAPHNALYERPALLDMIADPSNLRVLDIGTGSGFFLAVLLERGAAAGAGIDGTAAMVRAAHARTGGRADIRLADLRDPLPFPDDAFDLAVASLVLHYIEDWPPLLRELHRILRPRGRIILSTGHPIADLEVSQSGNYFLVERIEEEWGSFNATMPAYRRPLSIMLNDFANAGFKLVDLREPRPLPEMANVRPKSYDKLIKRPGFICMSFVTDDKT